jgi:GDP-L-fucose synthase
MFKKSKIYIAGHSGLLGSAIFTKLISAGYENIIARTHNELDLTKQSLVESFFNEEKPEYVFLCAGLTGGIFANKTYPANFLYTNIAIQNNIFEAAQKYEVKHLVFYGSSCVYPKFSLQPIKEEYLLTGEIESTSEAYAVAKMAGIIGARAFNGQYRTNRFIALIPNSIYGPKDNFDPDNSHVISALIAKFHNAKKNGIKEIVLWGSGTPRREFLFSDDAADASLYAVLNAERLQNLHYNVGSGVDYSIKELAEMVQKIVGYEGVIIWDTGMPDGASRKLLDSSRFNGLGWKSATSLRKGLEQTYGWYVQNEEMVR